MVVFSFVHIFLSKIKDNCIEEILFFCSSGRWLFDGELISYEDLDFGSSWFG
ncbi:19916_t:CDS:1, partial [Gigaspora rosea]